LAYVAIGIVLSEEPDPPEVLGFEQAARIADRLGIAMAAPPARRRNCRRFMGWGVIVCASSRAIFDPPFNSHEVGYHSRPGRARHDPGLAHPDPLRPVAHVHGRDKGSADRGISEFANV
jgi:hypothetical protein